MKRWTWLLMTFCSALATSCLTPRSGVSSSLGAVELGNARSTKADNPFTGARFFINPAYVESVEAAAAADQAYGELLMKVAAFPTAFWLDDIDALQNLSTVLDQALEQQAKTAQPVVPVFVVYNLPNRDCAAASSNGELTIEGRGEERYRTEYIDVIESQFRAHGSQRIVAIIEPDSLPNIVTNMTVPKCAASKEVYLRSVAYAISKLSMPHVYLYLDAAHAGWLGWEGNRAGASRVFRHVLNLAGGIDKIRGFATNVSNYTPLYENEGGRLDSSNPCPNEMTYVKELADDLEDVGIENPGFIIDTSRNGRAGIRKAWGSWCNIKGAGLGERPRVSPAELVDAFFWIKPPGESDGTSDASAPRFDPSCQSSDSAQGAPQAGQWFQSFFVELARNANPPL
ncbi:MAG: glycoside hydrolase family 6 protein [Deltaproteobacteria bacterium]|nr:glycoside hydrolase family 6 protein [Deltaproteobacteria bacterium]